MWERYGLCPPNIVVNCKPEMNHLRKIERKTKREGIRNKAVRLGLGIIPLRKII